MPKKETKTSEVTESQEVIDLKKEVKRLRDEVIEANKKTSGGTVGTVDADSDPTDADRLTRYTASMLSGVARLPTNPEALRALMEVINTAANNLVETQSSKELD